MMNIFGETNAAYSRLSLIIVIIYNSIKIAKNANFQSYTLGDSEIISDPSKFSDNIVN